MARKMAAGTKTTGIRDVSLSARLACMVFSKGVAEGGRDDRALGDPARRQFSGDPFLEHDENPVRESDQLDDLAGGDDDADAGVGQLPEQPVDLEFRPDV